MARAKCHSKRMCHVSPCIQTGMSSDFILVCEREAFANLTTIVRLDMTFPTKIYEAESNSFEILIIAN